MRILVAITGASGIIYGRRLAEELKGGALRKGASGGGKAGRAADRRGAHQGGGHEVYVVASEGAKKVAAAEGEKLPESDYDENDFSSPFASGSNAADAMVVCPCSLKTLGEIANGVGSNLVARAAEVMLKERRKLVLVVRETPLSYIAIKNMEKVTLAGGVILPACPGFYHKPRKVLDLVDFVVGKTLDQIGVENKLFKRWGK